MSKVWTSPPPAGTPIDWTHPLTRGMTHCYPFFMGTLKNYGSAGGVAELGTSAVWSIQHGLLGVGATAASQINTRIIIDPSHGGLAEQTMLGCAEYFGTDNDNTALFGDRNNSTQYMQLNWTDIGVLGQEDFLHNNTGDSKVYQPRLVDHAELDHANVNRRITAGFAGDGVAREVFFKDHDSGWFVYGDEGDGYPNSLPTYTPDSSEGFWLGEGRVNRHAFTAWHYFFSWDRKLQADEVRALLDNPWQIYQRKPKFAFADVPEDVRFEIVPKIWTRQPPAGTRIDWSNPLTRGLRSLTTFAEGIIGTKAYEHVSQRFDWDEQGSGDASIITDPKYGRVLSTRGANDTAYFEGNQYGIMSGKSTGSVAAIYRINAHQSSGGCPIIVGWSSGSTRHHVAIKDYAGEHQIVFRNSEDRLVTAALSTGRWYNAVGTLNSPLVSSYLDGVLLDSDSGNDVASHGDPVLVSCGNPDDAARAFDGDIALTAIWEDHELTAGEVASFNLNPWQIFEPRKIFVPINEKLPDIAMFERERDRQP